jgi:DNA replication protein DnaC
MAKISVLIIDDFAIAPIGPRERNDLLELIDDRVGTRACIVTSQLPVSDWHDYIGDPTLADAILDRLVHRAHRIHLKSDKSLRDRYAKKERASSTDSSTAEG